MATWTKPELNVGTSSVWTFFWESFLELQLELLPLTSFRNSSTTARVQRDFWDTPILGTLDLGTLHFGYLDSGTPIFGYPIRVPHFGYPLIENTHDPRFFGYHHFGYPWSGYPISAQAILGTLPFRWSPHNFFQPDIKCCFCQIWSPPDLEVVLLSPEHGYYKPENDKPA